MRIVTYAADGADRIGVLGQNDAVLDVSAAGYTAAGNMLDLIAGGQPAVDALFACYEQAQSCAELWLENGSVRLQAPIPRMRKNVFCVGRNYKFHIEESARAKGIPVNYPQVPEFFSKPATAVIGPDAPVKRYAALTDKLDYEVELAVVIGRTLFCATPDEAKAAIFGYTIVNDISARDLQMAHNQWFKGKALDSFCPIGPCIVTAEAFGDPGAHRISLRVNGELRQDSSTADLLFGIPEILSTLSAGLTLEAGDIVATGTPAGVAFGMAQPQYLQTGDVIEAEVDGIGVLRNPVAE